MLCCPAHLTWQARLRLRSSLTGFPWQGTRCLRTLHTVGARQHKLSPLNLRTIDRHWAARQHPHPPYHHNGRHSRVIGLADGT